MADILEKISKYQKAHDYFGKAETLYSSIKTIHTAAKIDPKDTVALEKLVGITDTETQKLLKVLNKRAKAAEEMAKSAFPPVECYTTEAWIRWSDAIDKFGEKSAQAKKGKQLYYKRLLDYDLALHERTSYCDLLVRLSEKQVKLYKGLVEVHTEAEKLCKLVIATPSTTGTAPQATAMKILLKFRGVPGPAKRIYKAHQKVAKLAKAHKPTQQKLRDRNQEWITALQREALNAMLQKALKAVGVAV